MEAGVYIADLVMKAIPRNKKSRLHGIVVSVQKYPIILDTDGSIPPDTHKFICKSLMKKRSSRYDDYVIKLNYSNQKFSTKVYGS